MPIGDCRLTEGSSSMMHLRVVTDAWRANVNGVVRSCESLASALAKCVTHQDADALAVSAGAASHISGDKDRSCFARVCIGIH